MTDNGGGEIINIASRQGHGRASTGGAHAVAKRGVIALTEVFAHEGREVVEMICKRDGKPFVTQIPD